MLKNIYKKYREPNRVVILGGGGFVSNSVEKELKKFNIKIKSFNHSELDLTKKDTPKKLKKILKYNDSLFFAAANAPVKNEKMLIENLIMSQNVCSSLREISIKHLVYLSSDAVYSDSKKPLKEKSDTKPESLHGIMHFSREAMISQLSHIPKCFIRPTLIFGSGDPHNGYGPNRFIRLSKKNKDINLFGKGEELRDHVWIDDVSKVICNVFMHSSIGKLNIATGKVISFKDIAKKIIKIYDSKSKIKYLKRNGPMPHGGYRSFDNSLIKKPFSNFSYTNFDTAVLNICKKK